MKQIDTEQIDRALLPVGTPMFADVARGIQDDLAFSEERKRDLISGLRRVARALGRSPEEAPADPRWLQPRLAKVMPAALGLTPKSWQNAVSDARSAMAHAGIVGRRQRRIHDLSPAWQQLWRAVLASKDPTLPPALSRPRRA